MWNLFYTIKTKLKVTHFINIFLFFIMHKIFPIFRIITSKRRVPKEALAVWGLENSIAYRNLSTSELYEIACESLLYP